MVSLVRGFYGCETSEKTFFHPVQIKVAVFYA